MITISYLKQTRKFILHNPKTKESIAVYCNYIGFANADLFTGIKATKRLNEGDVNKQSSPISSSLTIFSELGYLFPVIAFISIITSVVLFINYITSNTLMVLLAIGIVLLAGLIVSVLSNYFMQLCVFVIPGKSGWVEAYIDDYGTVSIPDKKSGKTIPVTWEIHGKKSIHLVTQKESESLINTFFGKEGLSNKKK